MFALLSTDRIVYLDSSKHFALEVDDNFTLGIHMLVIVVKASASIAGEELIYDIIHFLHCDEEHSKEVKL
jgi:hypothetical protein